MQSRAATVEEYLAELPEDRRAAVEAIRAVIRKNLPKGYEERMSYGMIGWAVPHSLYPAGYHCDPKQPLPFAGLASQKGHLSLYLMAVYMDRELEAWLRDAWKRSGHRLDMGKSCIRFRSVDDVPLAVVGEAIRRVPVAKLISLFETALGSRAKAKPTKKATTATKAKPAAKSKAVTKSKAAPRSAGRRG